jgi:hypothetical protein
VYVPHGKEFQGHIGTCVTLEFFSVKKKNLAGRAYGKESRSHTGVTDLHNGPAGDPKLC